MVHVPTEGGGLDENGRPSCGYPEFSDIKIWGVFDVIFRYIHCKVRCGSQYIPEMSIH